MFAVKMNYSYSCFFIRGFIQEIFKKNYVYIHNVGSKSLHSYLAEQRSTQVILKMFLSTVA